MLHLPVNPLRSKVFFCQFHDSMKPIPKGMLSVRQWLFTELRPTYHQARIVWITTCGAMLLKINVYKIIDKFKLTLC